MRESPTVELVEQLVGKGYRVSIYDPNVSLTQLMGANKAYIDRELPHTPRCWWTTWRRCLPARRWWSRRRARPTMQKR